MGELQIMINDCFLGDNSTRKSYFGWMYKEKITRVNKVVNKLENFISEINLLIQKNRDIIFK